MSERTNDHMNESLLRENEPERQHNNLLALLSLPSNLCRLTP